MDFELFSRVTQLRRFVEPLDKELINSSASRALGAEIREQLNDDAGLRLGRTIGASVALSAARGAMPPGGLESTSERIAQMYGGQLGIRKSLVENWNSQLRKFAGGIASFIEQQQELDEQTNDFVQAHGWPVPLHLPIRAYRRVVGLAGAGRREVNAMMRDGFRPGTKAFRATSEVLLTSPQFESRRPMIRQALGAHRRRDWYLVINTLLPLVEGLLVDFAYRQDAPPTSGRPSKSLDRLRETRDRSFQAAIETLEAMLTSAGGNVTLYARFDPADYGGAREPRSLNRHAILHGAARKYGSEQNSLRLILLLTVMAQSFDLVDESG